MATFVLFLKTEKFSILRNRIGGWLLRAGASSPALALPQLLHAAVDFADAFDGELAVDHVEGVG